MSSFPKEVYFEILLKVPVKSLLVCKCVCKTWFSLICNPEFVKKQLNLTIQRNKPNLMLKGFHWRNGSIFYTIDHDELLSSCNFFRYAVEVDYPFKTLTCSVQLMICCDGLVCLWYRMFFVLWNPATRKYRELPKPDIQLDHVDMVAFGYDYKSNDYKLLAGISGIASGTLLCTFSVYSLQSNSWKTIKNMPCETPCLFRCVSEPQGVLVNGDFHWLVKRDGSSDVVVSLDISNEIIREIMELPISEKIMGVPKEQLRYKSTSEFLTLGVLEGCLCLIVMDQYADVEIWVMQSYGVPESWTLRYSVNDIRCRRAHRLKLMWSFKNGEILFGSACVGLLLYNPEDGEVIKPSFSNLTKVLQHEHYFESLISP